jgi:hypothetical protein
VLQPFYQQGGINPPVGIVQFAQMREELAIGFVVEVFLADDQGHVVAALLQQYDTAENRLFGFEAPRRLPIEDFGSDLGASAWAVSAFDNGHLKILRDRNEVMGMTKSE